MRAPTPPAQLWLEFQRPAGGRGTVARVRRQDVPWRVVRGFATPSGETLALVNNTAGGVFDSDRLETRIDVRPGAWAQVTTTGATRIYRSRGPERCARSAVEAYVGQEGYLEYLPDWLIPFAGSRHEQSIRVHLASGASLIWWELVAPGREASGEVFRYDRLSSSFEIIADGRPITREYWELAPALRRLDSPVRLGPFRYFATLYVCRSITPAPAWGALEGELERVAEETSGTGDLLWGASSLRAA